MKPIRRQHLQVAALIGALAFTGTAFAQSTRVDKKWKPDDIVKVK
jgi:hypothetical protein